MKTLTISDLDHLRILVSFEITQSMVCHYESMKLVMSAWVKISQRLQMDGFIMFHTKHIVRTFHTTHIPK